MYAVIRAGGKQYRVAPGDVVRVETQSETDGTIEFNDVLAVSSGDGKIGPGGSGALVTGQVLEHGRAKKILVFHYKRKKQYKKLRGHRQNFSSVRITEIAYGGQKFTAPALPTPVAKEKKAEAEAKPKTGPRMKAQAPSHTRTATPKAHAAKAPAKKAVAKKAAPKKAAKKK